MVAFKTIGKYIKKGENILPRLKPNAEQTINVTPTGQLNGRANTRQHNLGSQQTCAVGV